MVTPWIVEGGARAWQTVRDIRPMPANSTLGPKPAIVKSMGRMVLAAGAALSAAAQLNDRGNCVCLFTLVFMWYAASNKSPICSAGKGRLKK